MCRRLTHWQRYMIALAKLGLGSKNSIRTTCGPTCDMWQLVLEYYLSMSAIGGSDDSFGEFHWQHTCIGKNSRNRFSAMNSMISKHMLWRFTRKNNKDPILPQKTRAAVRRMGRKNTRTQDTWDNDRWYLNWGFRSHWPTGSFIW